MANYNTFVCTDCRTRKVLLVTSSARKARSAFGKGVAVEIWNDNKRIERITVKDCRYERNPLAPYIEHEKAYIAERQRKATARNAWKCQ